MTDISRDDIAALREQGDLKEFLQSLGGRPPAKPKPPEPAVAPELPRSRPGAWPDGTRPPDPPPPSPASDWQQALDEHRAWLLAGEPIGDDTCHCPACEPFRPDPEPDRSA